MVLNNISNVFDNFQCLNDYDTVIIHAFNS